MTPIPGFGASSAAPVPARVTPLPALVGRRVLVVDDQEVVARSTSRLLDLFGARSTVARRADEALVRLEAQGWDLLLLDLALGDADGRDVLRRARALHPDLPVVVMSGLPPADLPPGVSFLAKPFAVAGLLQAVEAALA